ncbi:MULTISPECIES: hypothetical protein [Stenotrophomonas]|uniref:hypothetical protein n=1 Tax=Stenotrophomonas TaxID=40323 RepID=UPI00201D1E73|nr:hypothetical protein [Stenotrophomonas rhizophila]UQY86474.1 hypothetical protein LQE85_13350 [Stenotrophomonas rhizophila]
MDQRHSSGRFPHNRLRGQPFSGRELRLRQEAANHLVDGEAILRSQETMVASTAMRQISMTRSPSSGRERRIVNMPFSRTMQHRQNKKGPAPEVRTLDRVTNNGRDGRI